MFNFRALFLALSLTLPNSAWAMALPESLEERATIFAECAGRMLALQEHHSMFDGEIADQAKRMREMFLDLLEAVERDALDAGMPPGRLLEYRIMGRVDQKSLLRMSAFSDDPRARGPAAATAEFKLSLCKGLIPNV